MHNNGCFGETSVAKLPESSLKGSISGDGLEENTPKHYDKNLLVSSFNPAAGKGSDATYIADRQLTYQPPKCITDVKAKDIYSFKVDDREIRFTLLVKGENLCRFQGSGLIFSADNGVRDGFHIAGVDVGCDGLHVHGKHPCTEVDDPAPSGCGQGKVTAVQ